jgi:uncharacterized protein YijF (DUF1287 family)
MNKQTQLTKTNTTGSLLGALLLAALTQGAINADAQSVGITINPPIVVTPPAVVVQDDYQYYPSYGIYYNTYRHQYAHLNGDAWVLAPTPQGVTADVLLASPSVHMDFHDSLANHHKEMLQKYPKSWRPSAEHHDQKEERKDDRSDHNNKDQGH